MEDNSFPFSLLAIFVAFVCFGVWFVVDAYLIGKFDGKIKRGIKIWSKELSYDSWQYLLGLKNDVVEYQTILFLESKTAFIRVQDTQVLIYSTPRHFRSSWEYVGYVDLTSPNPELEYRASLPGIIFLIPFTVFGLLIFFVNFIFQTRAIDSYLENKTREYSSMKENPT